jgi:hypothetical protein
MRGAGVWIREVIRGCAGAGGSLIKSVLSTLSSDGNSIFESIIGWVHVKGWVCAACIKK